MSDSERYAKALAFATKKHDGQYRIGGLPYITHPVAVAGILREQGYDTNYQITGLFHDLLEDTDATVSEIKSLGSPEIADAVQRLTKMKGYVMAEYVAGIRANPMAMVVKAADRLHNLHCAVDANRDFRRKYILESIDWYLDFSPEIPKAVKALILTLDDPICGLPLEYRTVLAEKLHTDQNLTEKGRGV